jgi:hypothetical protein
VKLFHFLAIIAITLILFGCSQETNTEQQIALNEIKKDPKVDIFLYDFSVYKKVKTLNNLDLNDYETIGKIKSNYLGNGEFKKNMATKLPIDTELFKGRSDSQKILAKTQEGYVLYQSIPEG